MRVSTINGCHVQASDVDSLRDIFSRYARQVTEQEPGCLFIRLHRDAEDSGHFLIYSEFEDEAAYQAHLQTAHLAELRERLYPLIGDSHHKSLLHPL